MRLRLVLLGLLCACGGTVAHPATSTPPAEMPVTEVSLADVGLDELALDRSADPCEDFYQFACGTWLARTEIPADRSEVVRSFDSIQERNLAGLRGVLEKAAQDTSATDPIVAKIGPFYASCMDEAAIEKAGIAPVKPLLAIVAKVRDPKTLSAALAELQLDGITAFWRINSRTDARDATQVIASIAQGGLGLPDRDYYLRTDDDSRRLLAFYQDHVAVMLGSAGWARATAKDVVALETEIAKISKKRTELRDPVKSDNRVDRDGLLREAPHLDWDGYFLGLGMSDVKPVTVSSLEFLQGLDRLLVATPMPIVRAYLAYHIMEDTAELLGKKLQAAHFALEQTLEGTKEKKVRWKECVESTDDSLGMLLAQAYVKESFAGDSKEKADALMTAIAGAMDENLGVLDWMDDATRKRARDKLQKMTYQIGYPDVWRAYDFAIEPSAYARNVLAGRRFEVRRDLAKIGKPVDKKDWGMTPPTVNAYYSRSYNAMVFPAGILQPPFFDRKSAVAVNFGAIGMVMGHELTHGFDDRGSQFDGDGNLKDWWSPAAGARFKEKTTCVVGQYSQYEALPGVRLNGELTTGENIADIGGLKLAFAAYRKQRASARERIRAGGFSEDQLFYLGFAQALCTNHRPELARLAVQTDSHSPAHWRVNGAVSDEPEFASTFQCKAGAKMHPLRACVVW